MYFTQYRCPLYPCSLTHQKYIYHIWSLFLWPGWGGGQGLSRNMSELVWKSPHVKPDPTGAGAAAMEMGKQGFGARGEAVITLEAKQWSTGHNHLILFNAVCLLGIVDWFSLDWFYITHFKYNENNLDTNFSPSAYTDGRRKCPTALWFWRILIYETITINTFHFLTTGHGCVLIV